MKFLLHFITMQTIKNNSDFAFKSNSSSYRLNQILQFTFTTIFSNPDIFTVLVTIHPLTKFLTGCIIPNSL